MNQNIDNSDNKWVNINDVPDDMKARLTLFANFNRERMHRENELRMCKVFLGKPPRITLSDIANNKI